MEKGWNPDKINQNFACTGDFFEIIPLVAPENDKVQGDPSVLVINCATPLLLLKKINIRKILQ
jgi:hypothetical protein